MSVLAFFADVVRPSVPLAPTSYLHCPRCRHVKRRVSARERALLLARIPLMHRRCGARFERGTH